MPSYNPAIVCCCIEDTMKVCCLTLTMRAICNKVTQDTCESFPETTPQIIEWEESFKYPVKNADACNCSLSEGSGGGYSTGDIIGCTATFHDVKFGSPEDEEDLCPPSQKKCVKWKCGPCFPLQDGCIAVDEDEDCPSAPVCEPAPCCDTPPPSLCCCINLDENRTCHNGVACISCPPESGSLLCAPINNCESCTPVTPPPGGGIQVVVHCPGYGEENGIGYYDFDGIMGTCQTSMCVRNCPSGGGILCNCPVVSVSPCGGGAIDSFTDPMSGILYDSKTKKYKPDTVFLFAYGVKHL